MLTDDQKRIIEISNGLHQNQLMLANYKKGDPEPNWSKPKKETDDARQHQG